jgi:enoyl-CoA hydratase/carnithine racemase
MLYLQKKVKMDYKTISVSRFENIIVLKLNYPQKLNALSQQLFDEFDHAIETIRLDKDCRVLLIKGTETVFSAGGDLKEIGAADYEKALLLCMRVQKSFGALPNLNIPVIALLDGIVFGGGMELALHCDVRLVAETAMLRLPESDLGLIPGAGGISLLSRYISLGDAAYFLYTGRQIPLDYALEKGLIQKIVKKDELNDYAMEFAKELCLKSPESLSAIKTVLYSGLFGNLNDTMTLEAREFSSVLQRSGKDKIKQFFNSKTKK